MKKQKEKEGKKYGHILNMPELFLPVQSASISKVKNYIKLCQIIIRSKISKNQRLVLGT